MSPERARLIPEDVEDFVKRVYVALGGVYPSTFDQQEREEYNRKVVANRRRSELANRALDYLRLEEALGRPPKLEQFGRSRFEYRAEEAGLGPGVEGAWAHYERVVREALVREDSDRQARLAEGHEQRGSDPEDQLPEGEAGATRAQESGAKDARGVCRSRRAAASRTSKR